MVGLFLVPGIFVALGLALLRYARRYGPFGSFLAALFLGILFFKIVFPGVVLPGGFLIPGIAMAVTGATGPLPVPAVAFWGYVMLVATGALLVASSDDESLREFMKPPLAFLRGDFDKTGRFLRHLTLWVVFPLVVGWMVLKGFMPSTQPPIESRLAHPSITYNPDLINPLRNPDEKTLNEFAASHGLAELSRQVLSTRFRETVLSEGRHLYGKNCSPCHGGKANGSGHLAGALRLRPVDFTDPGTIATLVEGYAFQRIMDGGIGLPAAGSPWDSAMPSWKNTLTEEEIFKILLAEYDLAGVSPRVPEKE